MEPNDGQKEPAKNPLRHDGRGCCQASDNARMLMFAGLTDCEFDAVMLAFYRHVLAATPDRAKREGAE